MRCQCGRARGGAALGPRAPPSPFPVPPLPQENLGVMSIGFMLPNPDDAVIWRGPRKNGLIKQCARPCGGGVAVVCTRRPGARRRGLLAGPHVPSRSPARPLPLPACPHRFLKDVHWGPCDYLIIDTPPGTSDEHISVVQVRRAGGGCSGMRVAVGRLCGRSEAQRCSASASMAPAAARCWQPASVGMPGRRSKPSAPPPAHARPCPHDCRSS